MRLNKLHIFGFKSFADEVVLEFRPGLTAIVGPNGCGKSNICDAIRWVLGEQSAHILRGKEMGDVLFSGTTSCKPLSMAEVTLELTNLGSLPIDFHEVQITRKLYRSGESEYFLNKRPSRLKDITDLFLDWGVNKRIYSVIEQGNIDFILTTKPQERRILVETAAGTLRYKERKRETEQRIEHTRENLGRIEEKRGEVEIQRESLSKQAKRARLYQTICQQSQGMEMRFLTLRYKLLSFHLRKAQSAHQKESDEENGIIAWLANCESDRERAKLEVIRLESEFESLRKLLWQGETEKGEKEKRLETLQQEKKLREESLERLKKEAGALRERHLQAEQSQLDLEKQIFTVQTEFSKKERTYKGLEEEKAKFQRREKGLIETLDIKKKESNTLHSQLKVMQNNLSHLKAQRDALKKRLAEYAAEERERAAEEKRIEESLGSLNKNREGLTGKIKELRDTLHGIKSERENSVKKQKEKQQQIDKQKDICAHILHKKAHLEDLEKEMEGFHSSVRHLLKGDSGSLRKTLAQIISPEKGYEYLLSALLGEHLQDILVKSPDEALEMIADLKRSGQGRGTFLPEYMKGREKTPDVDPAVMAHPGYSGKMLDKVHCPERYQTVISWFLAAVLVVKDIQTALEIKNTYRLYHYTFITPDGDIVSPEGIFTGGSIENSESALLLSRKRELEEMKERFNQEKKILETLIKEGEEKARYLEQLNREIERVGAEVVDLEGRHRDSEREIRYLTGEQEKLSARRNKIDRGKTEGEQESHKIEQALLSEGAKEIRLKEDLTGSAKEIQELEVEWNGIKKERSAVQNNYMAEGIALASLKERLSALMREKGKAEESFRHRERDLGKNQEETEGIAGRIDQIGGEIEVIQKEMPEHIDKALAHHENLKKIKDRLDRARRDVLEKDEMIRPASGKLEQMRKRLKSIEVEITEWRTRLDDLQQDFSFPIPDEALTEEEIPLCEKELERVKERLEKLKTRMQGFGPVNMGAIEEFQAIDERYQFLNRQCVDLQSAIESLRSIIREINATSRELFQETFKEVNRIFQDIFVRLFEGGQAELCLEEGMDVLEAGVNIIAQPPGKRLQRIDLLSGGEKALTALALIFAVYQLKPSPFCILDEVDAPLDEANVERFLRLLKEMKAKTQFICITHCKRTMMEVDTIYGITMDTPGISKLVSIKLDQKAELSASPAPAQGRPLFQEVMQ